MSEWIKVVTQPIGLIGFVLFLVFGVLARANRRAERRWLLPAAVVLAVIALVGGLGLAYLQVKGAAAHEMTRQANPVPTSSPQTPTQIQQITSGPGSPAVQGVGGSVSVTIDQSSGKTKPQDDQGKKHQQKNVQ
jgi:hypothetical protein